MRLPSVNKHLQALVFQVVLVLACFPAHAQLRLNEVSQGAGGTQEYVELVVVGNRTCTDSCADIRHWVLDDNNGWLGAASAQGIATGCLRFSNDAVWSCVPYGSIILVYNNSDKNPSITIADDPTDANHDKVYIVPAGSTLMEGNGSTPISPSSATYTYPTTGFTAGSNPWTYAGMSNTTGDGFIVTSPANLGQAYHSLGYGSLNNAANASVYFSTGGAAKVYSLTNDQYNNAASWTVGNAPADETPGLPNTPANSQWINSMRTAVGTVNGAVLRACINPGMLFTFNGQFISASGIYKDTFVSAAGCDSIITLNFEVKIPTNLPRNFIGCGSFAYKNNVYTSNATVYDTIRGKFGCDSVYIVNNITIHPANAVNVKDTIIGCDQIIYNGNTYTTSTTVRDTVRSAFGCDSVYRERYLNLVQSSPVTITDSVRGCRQVLYRDKVYTQNGAVTDTLRGAYGCDSIYKQMLIIILPQPDVAIDPADTIICRGDTAMLRALTDYSRAWSHVIDTTGVFELLGSGATQTVQPPVKTRYALITVDPATRCRDTAYAQVRVDTFNLSLLASGSLVRKYSEIVLTTDANLAYHILSWSPESLFPNQTAIGQKRIADETYKYTVIGESDIAHCRDTASTTIKVDKTPADFLPNVFSPNGDGLNDYFGPAVNVPVGIVVFNIYNRWGELIYTVSNKMSNTIKGWDGTYNGTAVSAGVYVYYITFAAPDGTILYKQGNVTVMH